jgi:metal-dependent amidase/aminoacylase/carboxypeptidase family protein
MCMLVGEVPHSLYTELKENKRKWSHRYLRKCLETTGYRLRETRRSGMVAMIRSQKTELVAFACDYFR